MIVGGGIMGLGSAFHLAKSGRCSKVTVIEAREEVAGAASNINGSMICPSLCASWASFKFLAKVVRRLCTITSELDERYKLQLFMPYTYFFAAPSG